MQYNYSDNPKLARTVGTPSKTEEMKETDSAPTSSADSAENKANRMRQPMSTEKGGIVVNKV